MSAGKSYSLDDLATRLGARTTAENTTLITGIASLADAGEGDITFLARAKFSSQLENCKASAILVSEEFAGQCPCPALVVDNPYLAYARLSRLFIPDSSQLETGVSPAAIIHPDASISETASIAAGVIVERGALISEDVQLFPGVVVSAGARIGAGTIIYPNVTVYHDVKIGSGCVIHANTVIGADGFGFAPGNAAGNPSAENETWVKIHQLGSVTIGDHVEIGASCTIDRGALGDTIIEDQVILDDQVHIAHNCKIGFGTGIAGATAIAGSTSIGKNCTIAGAVGIVGHLEIADNVHITAMSLVTHSIREPGSYSSGTAMSPTQPWRKNAVRFNQLDEMARRLRHLEQQLAELKKQ